MARSLFDVLPSYVQDDLESICLGKLMVYECFLLMDSCEAKGMTSSSRAALPPGVNLPDNSDNSAPSSKRARTMVCINNGTVQHTQTPVFTALGELFVYV